jgi:hypothetical protein
MIEIRICADAPVVRGYTVSFISLVKRGNETKMKVGFQLIGGHCGL